MPNHVHVLAAFADGAAMKAQIAGWKRFTARRINKRLGRDGRFWQKEDFDHLVRSDEQFAHYQRYIAKNGPAAGLAAGEYRHWRKM